ncbi:MAG: alpha/beta fold hydrolase [Candidatus Limnocylindrales bacterium]
MASTAKSARDVRVVLAHGASGDATSMRPHVDGLRARGVDAYAIDLPKRKAEEAVPAYVAALAALPPTSPDAALVVGGHSYGGRVASLLVAGVNMPTEHGEPAPGEPQPIVGGLVCFSYPLHLPGRPERGLRTEHWPAIDVPTLILEGESDPFARIELLRGAMPLLPRGRLVTYPGLGHGLVPVLDDALDALVNWLDEVVGSR